MMEGSVLQGDRRVSHRGGGSVDPRAEAVGRAIAELPAPPDGSETDTILAFSAPMRERLQAELWARVWRALVLAPTVEVFEALLRGESVPLSRLDADAVKRFGRRAVVSERVRLDDFEASPSSAGAPESRTRSRKPASARRSTVRMRRRTRPERRSILPTCVRA